MSSKLKVMMKNPIKVTNFILTDDIHKEKIQQRLYVTTFLFFSLPMKIGKIPKGKLSFSHHPFSGMTYFREGSDDFSPPFWYKRLAQASDNWNLHEKNAKFLGEA